MYFLKLHKCAQLGVNVVERSRVYGHSTVTYLVARGVAHPHHTHTRHSALGENLLAVL
jgi:hypothetical protein